jgi:uncharacterized membrane protein
VASIGVASIKVKCIEVMSARVVMLARPAGKPPAPLLVPGRARYIQTMADQHPQPEGALLFEAVIMPHRSLSPRGLAILLGAISFLCGLTALRFWLIGAWPVIGFSVVEVGLALWLIRANARSARASEMVLLSENALRIVRIDPRGRRQERRLNAAWLNIVIEEAPGRVPRLVLAARNVREEIAAALGEAEKRDLAAALGAALHRRRNPVFDNSQLREQGN